MSLLTETVDSVESRRWAGVWLVVAMMMLAGGLRAARADEAVDFDRDIRPILAKHCFTCHGPDEGERKAGLRLDRKEDATRALEDGTTAVVPGDPEGSELVFRVEVDDDLLRMPPKKMGAGLEPAQVGLLRRWIEEGATYAPHWSFSPPKERELPVVKQVNWPRNGIDNWILKRLEREGIAPSEEADGYTLLRRASLDLRGLPPSPREVAQFAEDDRPGAYERAVDRFLADPAFGERWARVWLDLARYADSAGYGSDPLRPDVWRYRDWVIDALNTNMPYDQFSVEQIAGDLLPEPSREQLIATAFNRNTMTNTEGGTDDEEFRVAAIKDRVDTTIQVWMGVTVGCAKCHSHKYDPISQSEYYRLFAIFNQTADNDQPDERPTMPAPTRAMDRELARIDREIEALKVTLETPTEALAEAQERWETERQATERDWSVLRPEVMKAESGATFEVDEEGIIRVSGTRGEKDVYSVEARTDLAGISAVRLEVLPGEGLPSGGSGRADDGNFVLSHLGVEAEPVSEEENSAPRARFVRVELPGEGKMLSLAEVEVFSEGENVAPKGQARQSSVDYGGEAGRAIDGNTNGDYFQAHSVTHTKGEKAPWWEVDLGESRGIERVVVWNRTDGGTGSRLADFRVVLLDEARRPVWTKGVSKPPAPSRALAPTGRQELALRTAVADFSQEKFPVEAALKPANSKTGWAVAPRQTEAHSAVFSAEAPLGMEPPVRLRVRLEHRFKDAGYALGRFRVSVTNAESAVKRASVPADVLAVLDTPKGDRTEEQRERIAKYYRSIAPELKPVREEIAKLEKSKPKPPKVPIMEELAAEKRRETHLLNKGNFLDPGPTVGPGVPEAFHELPEEAKADRLGLARWLVDERNPLTARVAVNRFWARVFGTGIVETEEDFGTQGDRPSHPELLDWLAVEFMRSGWDVKGLLRTMVTSATYRQSSRVRPELREIDPRNRLLARATRFRLEAEMVRDQALALSGLLSREVGGPSVFPPQPEGLWQAAFNGQRTWATSEGNERHRRGLYTFWRRTVPYPSMAVFDAPSREICTLRRVRTNTPLQAFVTLNDPAYVEAAQALGRRIVREGGESVEERARFALTLCLGRPPKEGEIEVLGELFERERARYADQPEAAKALATEPLGPLPEGMEAAEMAAWTTVANVLLNLDGVLTRG